MKIALGAMCKPLHQQLADGVAAGLALMPKPDKIKLLQRCADAITLLLIHGILTDREGDRARRRLVKQIGKDVQDAIRSTKTRPSTRP